MRKFSVAFPWSIKNIEGMVIITGEGIREYQTIVYEDSGRYIGIYHSDRMIWDMSKIIFNHNYICCSNDGYLYVLDSYIKKNILMVYQKKRRQKLYSGYLLEKIDY